MRFRSQLQAARTACAENDARWLPNTPKVWQQTARPQQEDGAHPQPHGRGRLKEDDGQALGREHKSNRVGIKGAVKVQVLLVAHAFEARLFQAGRVGRSGATMPIVGRSSHEEKDQPTDKNGRGPFREGARLDEKPGDDWWRGGLRGQATANAGHGAANTVVPSTWRKRKGQPQPVARGRKWRPQSHISSGTGRRGRTCSGGRQDKGERLPDVDVGRGVRAGGDLKPAGEGGEEAPADKPKAVLVDQGRCCRAGEG